MVQQITDGEFALRPTGDGKFKLVVRQKSTSPAQNKNLNSKVSFKTLHKVGEETKWTKKF